MRAVRLRLRLRLLLEMARRAQPDRQWLKPDTALLTKDAWQQATYCLDAPDESVEQRHELRGTKALSEQLADLRSVKG